MTDFQKWASERAKATDNEYRNNIQKRTKADHSHHYAKPPRPPKFGKLTDKYVNSLYLSGDPVNTSNQSHPISSKANGSNRPGHIDPKFSKYISEPTILRGIKADALLVPVNNYGFVPIDRNAKTQNTLTAGVFRKYPQFLTNYDYFCYGKHKQHQLSRKTFYQSAYRDKNGKLHHTYFNPGHGKLQPGVNYIYKLPYLHKYIVGMPVRTDPHMEHNNHFYTYPYKRPQNYNPSQYAGYMARKRGLHYELRNYRLDLKHLTAVNKNRHMHLRSVAIPANQYGVGGLSSHAIKYYANKELSGTGIKPVFFDGRSARYGIADLSLNTKKYNSKGFSHYRHVHIVSDKPYKIKGKKNIKFVRDRLGLQVKHRTIEHAEGNQNILTKPHKISILSPYSKRDHETTWNKLQIKKTIHGIDRKHPGTTFVHGTQPNTEMISEQIAKDHANQISVLPTSFQSASKTLPKGRESAWFNGLRKSKHGLVVSPYKNSDFVNIKTKTNTLFQNRQIAKLGDGVILTKVPTSHGKLAATPELRTAIYAHSVLHKPLYYIPQNNRSIASKILESKFGAKDINKVFGLKTPNKQDYYKFYDALNRKGRLKAPNKSNQSKLNLIQQARANAAQTTRKFPTNSDSSLNKLLNSYNKSRHHDYGPKEMADALDKSGRSIRSWDVHSLTQRFVDFAYADGYYKYVERHPIGGYKTGAVKRSHTQKMKKFLNKYNKGHGKQSLSRWLDTFKDMQKSHRDPKDRFHYYMIMQNMRRLDVNHPEYFASRQKQLHPSTNTTLMDKQRTSQFGKQKDGGLGK